MDDAVRVVAALRGDGTAFADLVGEYQTQVYNLAYRIVGPTEAEDAAQESFLRAYTQLATYKPEHKFSSWLLAITAHYCIDLVRRRKRWMDRLPSLVTDEVDRDTPEEAMVEQESRQRVQQLVTELPVAHRAVVVLHYWHDLSCAEIGQMLGLTETCVRVRLHRARHLLAAKLRSQRSDEPVGERHAYG